VDAPTAAPLQRLREAVAPVWDHRLAGPVVRGLLVYVLLVEVAVQLVFGRVSIPGIDIAWLELGRYDQAVPRGVMIGGAVIGALYGLVAMGIILVYRANRIINFAQAQLGAVPAVVALLLIARHGWPYLAVLPIMLIGAAVLGATVEITLIRRFSHAPRLILTVVTVGVGFLLLIFEFYAKKWVGGGLQDVLSLNFPTPFQRLTFRIGPATLTGDHLFAVAVVGALVIALGAFFRYTDIGIAVRASAENSDRASLLGIPVRRVSTIVWILAAVLSAIGVFLRTPLVGLPLSGFVGPSILLFGLAVAVIARMESLPTAFFGGMLIGIIDRSALFATRRASLANAVMLLVVVVALLAQRKQLSRAMDTGVSTWQAVQDFRPIPAELRRLPEVVWARVAIGVVVAALVVTAPWLLGTSYTPQATLMVLYAIIGVSLVVLTGWAGQISLGQYAIAGVGSAVAGGLAANHGWDFFGAVITGGFAGALIAVLIGIPALRIQGLFLAVTTLAFAFTVQNFVLRREFFGWLLPEDNAFVERPVLYGRFDVRTDTEVLWFTVSGDAKFYFLCLLFLGLTLGMAKALRRNRSGRILLGVRDNTRAMQAFGVNPQTTRLAAFAISGFMAGLAGALLAYQNVVFSPGGFAPEKSIELFVMAVIGGVGSLAGAMLGAVYVVGMPLIPGLRDIELIEVLTSGLGLLILLNFLPGGLAEGMFRTRDTLLRKVADRRGLYVPSLVADVRQEAERDEEQLTEELTHRVEEDAHPPADAVRCPVCLQVVHLDEAATHDHLALDGRGDEGDELVGTAPAAGRRTRRTRPLQSTKGRSS
jgi:branched-chain amino acid transport system permease protein